MPLDIVSYLLSNYDDNISYKIIKYINDNIYSSKVIYEEVDYKIIEYYIYNKFYTLLFIQLGSNRKFNYEIVSNIIKKYDDKYLLELYLSNYKKYI